MGIPCRHRRLHSDSASKTEDLLGVFLLCSSIPPLGTLLYPNPEALSQDPHLLLGRLNKTREGPWGG